MAVSSNRHAPITDPIVEPLWSGWRVLVHFDSAQPLAVKLIDQFGDNVADTEPDVVAELSDAILAVDAIIDGILTAQATRSAEGVAVFHDAHLNATNVFMARKPDVDIERPGIDDPTPVALVCLDLLRVDGQDLLDVPLLERRRILEGLVRGGDLVRVSPFTRPPVDSWVASWKAAGFKGAMLKSANGRYVPGRQTTDWVPLTRLRQI